MHAVFEYCRDPRRIYAGDPTHKVADARLTPEGVGTRALVVNRTKAFSEEVAIESVELVPDQRIAFEARPKMTITMVKRFVIRGSVHTWTWTFVPGEGGTRLTLVVVERGVPWWDRALDALTTRTFSKEIRGRLARIKEGAEGHAAPAQ